jgi:hypothetical protein
MARAMAMRCLSTGGKPHAIFSDPGLVTPRQASGKSVYISGEARGVHFFPGSGWATKEHIVVNGAVEDCSVLENNS